MDVVRVGWFARHLVAEHLKDVLEPRWVVNADVRPPVAVVSEERELEIPVSRRLREHLHPRRDSRASTWRAGETSSDPDRTR